MMRHFLVLCLVAGAAEGQTLPGVVDMTNMGNADDFMKGFGDAVTGAVAGAAAGVSTGDFGKDGDMGALGDMMGGLMGGMANVTTGMGGGDVMHCMMLTDPAACVADAKCESVTIPGAPAASCMPIAAAASAKCALLVNQAACSGDATCKWMDLGGASGVPVGACAGADMASVVGDVVTAIGGIAGGMGGGPFAGVMAGMGMECTLKADQATCTSDPNCQWMDMDTMGGAMDPMAGIPKCVEDCGQAAYPDGPPATLMASCDSAKAFLATCTACTAKDMSDLKSSFIYSMICPGEAKGHGGRRALRALKDHGDHDHDHDHHGHGGATCVSNAMAGAMSGIMDDMVKPMMTCAMQQGEAACNSKAGCAWTGMMGCNTADMAGMFDAFEGMGGKSFGDMDMGTIMGTLDNITANVDKLGGNFSTVMDNILIGMNASAGDVDKLVDGFKNKFDKDLEGMMGDMKGFGDKIDDVFDMVGDMGAAMGGKLGEVMDGMADKFGEALTGATAGDCGSLVGAMENFGAMGDMFNMTKNKKKDMTTKLKGSACWDSMKGDLGQFGGMMEDMVKNFDVDDVRSLTGAALVNASKAFGDWTDMGADMAAEVLTGFQKGDAFGNIATWDPETLMNMSGLVTHLPVDDLMDLGTRAVAGLAGAADKLNKDQIGAIAADFAGMADGAMKGLVDGFSDDAFVGALGDITKQVGQMSKDQVKNIKDKALAALPENFDAWTANMIDDMGELMTELDDAALEALDYSDDAIDAMGELHDWSEDQLGKVAGKAAEHFGAVADWGMDQFDKMGGLLNGLTKDVVDGLKGNKTNFEAAVKAATKKGANMFKKGSALFDAAAEEFADVGQWAADEIHMFGAAVTEVLNATTIDDLPDDAFLDGLDTLREGKGWAMDEFAALAEKGKKAFGGNLATLSKANGTKLGELVGAFDKEDIMALNPDAFLGALESSANDFLDLAAENVAAVVDKIENDFGAFNTWSGAEIKKLDRLGAKVFDQAEDLLALTPAAVDEAFDTFLSMEWPAEETEALCSQFKDIAGDVKTWTEENTKRAGKFLAGLPIADLDDIPVAAIAGFAAEAVEDLTPAKVAGFTKDQIKSLSTDARAEIQADKLTTLNKDQVKAAVCPNGACPEAVTDVVLSFDAEVTSQADVLAAMEAAFQTAGKKFNFEVLTVKKPAATAVAPGRRLSTATTDMTLRSEENNKEEADKAKTTATNAAVANVAVKSATSVAVAEDTTPAVNPPTPSGPGYQPSTNPTKGVSAANAGAMPSLLAVATALVAATFA